MPELPPGDSEALKELLKSWIEEPLPEGLQEAYERGCPSFRAAYREGYFRGLEEARHEVFEQARREGLKEVLQIMANLVVFQIVHEMGTLDPKMQECIRMLSMDHVSRLGEAIYRLKNAEDVSEWLTNNM